MFGWAVGEWRDGGSPFFVFQFTTAMCEGVCCVSEPFFASPPPNSGKLGNKKWGGGEIALEDRGGEGEKPFLAHSLLSPGQCVPPPLLPFPLAPQNLPPPTTFPGFRYKFTHSLK